MASPAETLSLVEARVRWLEGKNAAFDDAYQRRASAEVALVRSIGPRSNTSSWLTRLIPGLWLGEVAGWTAFDSAWAGEIQPYASDMRSAARSLEEVIPIVRSVRGLSAADVQTLRTYLARGRTALERAQGLAQTWQRSPSGRFDPNVTTFWEAVVRQISQSAMNWGATDITEAQIAATYQATATEIEAAEAAATSRLPGSTRKDGQPIPLWVFVGGAALLAGVLLYGKYGTPAGRALTATQMRK